jgi:hypothetical protein
MNPHLSHLATAFEVAAAVLAAPSLLGLSLCVFVRLTARRAKADDSLSSVKNPDAILLMLRGITGLFGLAGGLVGGAANVFFKGVAVASLVLLTLSVVLFLTGRGLHARRDGARVAGALVMGVCLFPSLLCLLTPRRRIRLLGIVATSASGYGLWALWNGFTA